MSRLILRLSALLTFLSAANLPAQDTVFPQTFDVQAQNATVAFSDRYVF